MTTGTLDAEAALFSTPQIAQRIAARVLGPAPGPAVTVRAGIEVRAPGALQVEAPLSFDAPALAPAGQASVGGVAVTLRAAGDVQIARSVQTGFTASAASPDGLPAAGSAGDLRVVAGADLASADLLATRRGAAELVAGSLRIGAAGNGGSTPLTVHLRSSSGAVEVAAALDVQLVNTRAAIMTTGRSFFTSAAAAATTGQPDLSSAALDLVPADNDEAALNPFLAGGGRVSVNAGRDVIGTPASADRPYFTNWWWRSRGEGFGIWWSRFDRYGSGVATFGGGDVQVSAGRDLRGLSLAAAGSGWVAPAGLRSFGGGSIAVDAERDLLGGQIFASGARLDVRAGGTLAPVEGTAALQLMHQATQVRLQSRGDLALASVRSAGLSAPVIDNNSAGDAVLQGLDNGAALHAVSATGNVGLANLAQPTAPGVPLASTWSALGAVIPAAATLVAPAGSVRLGGNAVQQPAAADARLHLLGAQSVGVTNLSVNARDASALLRVNELSAAAEDLAARRRSDGGRLDTSTRDAVRLVSTQDDVVFTGTLVSARPVRVVAARDVVLEGSGNLQVQHQPAGAGLEVSTVDAGRDIVARGGGAIAGIEIGGPGDLVLAAGRHVDLGVGAGLVAVGNQRNSTLLPEQASNITVVAAYAADSDLAAAIGRGFAALGARALLADSGGLYAWLAVAAGRSGEGFAGQPVDQRLTLAAALLGDSAAAAQARFTRQVPAWRGLDDAAAQQALAAAEPALKERAVEALLSFALEAAPAAVRSGYVDQALQRPSPYLTGLREHIQRSTGNAVNAGEVLSTFETLPRAQQLAWLAQVLQSELRNAGRDASAKSGSDREAAYAAGYLAFDALFPGVRQRGDIVLPTSQIKTVQPGSITLLAPGGGVNAGEVTGSTRKRANELGIVTVAGGGIFAATRDNFDVNQSRVFTLREGNVLLWSSDGNIDAGRGAKTVTGAPAPVLRLDDEGRLVLDTSGSFSGSGIAVLDSGSALDLYAPRGEINAGEAGIKSLGNAFFGAVRFVGADNLAVGGVSVGAPPAAPSGGATAGLASLGQSATSAGSQATSQKDDEDERKKRRNRRNVFLEFLGFTQGE